MKHMEPGTRTMRLTQPALDAETYDHYKQRVLAWLMAGGVFVVFENVKFHSVLVSIFSDELLAAGVRAEFHSDSDNALTILRRHAAQGAMPFVLLNHAEASEASEAALVRHVREDAVLEHAPLIVVSNQMYEEKVAWFTEMGADDIIVTPYAQNTIVRKVFEAIEPPEHKHWLRMGRRSLFEGAVDMARDYADKLTKKYPDLPISHELRGEIQHARQDDLGALKSFERAVELDQGGTYLAPRLHLATIYGHMTNRHRDDPEKLVHYRERELRYLEQLDALSPVNLDRKLRRSRIYIEKGQTEKAEGLLRRTYAEYAENKRSRTELQRAEALSGARKLIEVSRREFPDLAQEVIASLIEDERLFDALGEEEKLELRLEYGRSLATMATGMWDNDIFEELFDEARREYESALTISKNESRIAHINELLGQLFEEKGRRLEQHPQRCRAGACAPDMFGAAHGYYRRALDADESRSLSRSRMQALAEFKRGAGHDLRAGARPDTRALREDEKRDRIGISLDETGTENDKYRLFLEDPRKKKTLW